MDFGVTGKLGGYYLAEQYRKNAVAGKSEGVSFTELAAAKKKRREEYARTYYKGAWAALTDRGAAESI